MTQNQIAFANMRETQRANQAREEETRRANLEKERQNRVEGNNKVAQGWIDTILGGITSFLPKVSISKKR